ncbi:metal-dependent hydrolase [Clostridium thermobutyricum]|uniref:metal-dependent hydrolase n=1 Tax=Clostridium thermobutyricum TaxID=29372 RepID=UPI0029430FFA|nr:metal-dependent hydrolase [Clostridium thermobutyricum]
MIYRTHIATSSCVAIPLLLVTNEFNIVVFSSVIVGSILPDIDTPKSYISRHIPIIPVLINKKFQHRGIFHTPIFAISILIISIIFKFLNLVGLINTNMPSLIFLGLSLGYFLHLCGDGLSVTGIRWLMPFKKRAYPISDKKKYIKNFRFLKYKTNQSKEHIYFIISILLILLEIYFFKTKFTYLITEFFRHFKHYNFKFNRKYTI